MHAFDNGIDVSGLDQGSPHLEYRVIEFGLSKCGSSSVIPVGIFFRISVVGVDLAELGEESRVFYTVP